MKSSKILQELKGNFEMRVYRDGEFVITQTDRSEGESFAVINPTQSRTIRKLHNFEEYIDNQHQVKKDECGDEYTVWENRDLSTPFTKDDLDIAINYYLDVNN